MSTATTSGRPAEGGQVLRVEGLAVRTAHRPLVRDVTFSVGHGERVGLIGESGSGKSITALAALGLLPEELHASGTVEVTGHPGNLLQTPERRRARLRGDTMSMVFQEPMTALNPTMRIGRQVGEVLQIHGRGRGRGRAAARGAVEMLGRVGLPDPAGAARAYPHQLSGGQRQRVVLAIALANEPALLVCDEPTTALDVTVQARVLDLIVGGATERADGLLFITHDLAVVAQVCERVLVMHAGGVVEAGPVAEVFARPRHAYTRGLLAASEMVTDEDGMLLTTPSSRDTGPADGEARVRLAPGRDCVAQPHWHGTPERGHACDDEPGGDGGGRGRRGAQQADGTREAGGDGGGREGSGSARGGTGGGLRQTDGTSQAGGAGADRGPGSGTEETP